MDQPKHPSSPSSGTAGFFQDAPVVRGAWGEDEALNRVSRFYLSPDVREELAPDLQRFSDLVATEKVREWCADAERNVPYVRTHDAWGRRVDRLVTSEGWRNLQNMGLAEGIVAIGHEQTHARYSRVYQFLKYHIWTPWCALVTCPSAMQDGAAKMLRTQLGKADLGKDERRVFQAAYDHLVARDPTKAWTSGQWMTERPGGSDVQDTETQAIYAATEGASASMVDIDGNPLGHYSISGFKWFSSATDANSTVMLAREPNGAISAFFAPTKRYISNGADGELNGISIQRLKSKLGTRALPTAELVLQDMRAWRVGKSGQGVKEISTVLNVTRVHNAVSAVGFWGRGLAISRAFSRVRKARGRLLMDLPAHVRTLAEQYVEYHAMMHLAMYTAALLGQSENRPGKSSQVSPCERAGLIGPDLLRLLTPLAKMLTAKAGIAGLAECMESLGGVGYIENEDIAVNVARLYRDCNVLSIWEGTSNIMADDIVRILKGPAGADTLQAVESIVLATAKGLNARSRSDWAVQVSEFWRQLRQDIQQRSREDLVMNGRDLGSRLGWLVCAVLLIEDANSDDDVISHEIVNRWISRRRVSAAMPRGDWIEDARWDRLIVFGHDTTSKEPGSKL
ncbi:acyl- dehydrogenase like [Lecanosticta acicola]|uniref:Acyl- dehydrogenase like n=1 Tax=Lecanosticta acicola TaxID=111012 RepID=A0AAI9E936_9PEZI|nr:acyl- dehydrogenase like [Lecanosticta acicola]